MSKSNPTKIRIEITLSEEAWARLQTIAKDEFDLNVSELLEQVGKGQLAVVDTERLEDLLDTVDALEGLLAAKEEGTISWEEVKAELGL